MSSHYAPYLTINLTHEYFYSPLGAGLTVDPTAKTSHWLNQHGMVLKTLNNGLCILADHAYLQEIDAAPTELQFALHCTDTLFHNYTATPANDKTIALFEMTPETAIITETLPANQWLSADAFSNRCKLSPRDTAHYNAAYNLIGWLDFTLTTSLVSNLEATIELKFSPRKARWRYFFIDETAKRESEIIDINKTFTFEYSGEFKLSNGRNSLTFTSTEPISVFQRSPYHFQLKEDNRIKIRHLPVADPAKFTYSSVRQKNELIYSIFVT